MALPLATKVVPFRLPQVSAPQYQCFASIAEFMVLIELEEHQPCPPVLQQTVSDDLLSREVAPETSIAMLSKIVGFPLCASRCYSIISSFSCGSIMLIRPRSW